MASLDPARLPRATAWRLAYLVVQGASSTALLVVLGQVLPSAQFQDVAVATGVLVVAQAIGDFGLSQAAATALTAQVRLDPERGPALLSAAAVTFWIGSVAALVVVLGVAAVLPPTTAAPTAIVAPGAAAAVLVAGADGLLRGQGEFSRPVRLMVLSRLGGLAGIPAAAAGGTASWAAGGISIGIVLGTAPAAMLLLTAARGSGRSERRWFLRATAPLGLAQLLVVGSARLNTVILSGAGLVGAAAGFEAGWRLYQLGQYAGGVLAGGAAPIMAASVGHGRRHEARTLTVRLLALALALGTVLGLALWLCRTPVARALFPPVAPQVARLLRPLAIALPFGLCSQVAAVLLSSVAAERRHIAIAYGIGASVNMTIVIVTLHHGGAVGAAAGSAAAAVVTSVWLCWRCYKWLGDTPRRAAPRDAPRHAP